MGIMVTVKLNPVEVAFEVGSLAEAVNALNGEKNALTELIGINAGLASETPAEAVEPAKAPRGRPRKEAPVAPVAAPVAAPPPIPVPVAPVAAPVIASAAQAAGIPAFLDRTVAPAASDLKAKIIADLKKRAAGSPDAGKSLADWLATAGACVPGASFDEAVAVLQFQADDKLAPLAAALGVQ